MANDQNGHLTETEERAAENASVPPHRAPVTRDYSDNDPATGLPPGMHDDDSSPLDAGGKLDVTRGNAKP